METNISTQLWSLSCFAALGLGLGLLYDMLRPLRYHKNIAFWDFLFCLCAAFGCFLLAMFRTKAGIWELASTLLCFCLYINYLSPLLLPPILGTFALMHNCYKFIQKKVKKLQILVKKFFTNEPD